jgi:four helix bundle protein
MKENKLVDQSFDFAKDIIFLVKDLKEKRESVMSNQIGRSGTSIGANINEAQYAQSKADFVSKLQIALKEANETRFWLNLLFETGYIDEKLFKDADGFNFGNYICAWS